MRTPTPGSCRRHPIPSPRSVTLSRVGALTLLGLLLAGPAAAQTDSGSVATSPARSDPGVVFGVGGGVGSRGAAGILSLGIPLGPGELVLRSGGTASMNFFGPSEATGDLGVLYGVRKAGSRGWARVAGGMGIVSHEWSVPRAGSCDNWLFGCGYDLETRSGAGLLGQADAVWALHRNFGLGATLYGGLGLGGEAYGAMSIGLFIGRGGTAVSR